MTSVNPEISCIRMGSGPALFGISEVLLYSYCALLLLLLLLLLLNDAVINKLFASIVFNNNFNHGRLLPTPRVSL